MRLPLAAVSTVVLLVPGVALAGPTNLIKVDKSINAIKVGNSEKKVIQKMGTDPLRVRTGVNQFGEYRVLFFADRFTVTVVKGGVGVTNMETTSPAQRTSIDIGVGSSKKQVRSAYSVVCEPVPSQPGRQSCATNPDPKPGQVATLFRLRNKVVTQVGIGTVLD